MSEINKNKEKIKIRTFNFKWYEFLIIYGIFNIFFFLSINAVINNIYKIFLQFHVSNFTFDGSDFSILANLFAAPIIALMVIINMGIFILEEFIIILLIKLVYFISTVKDEEKSRLYKYIRNTLLCFVLPNLTGIIFRGDTLRTIFFILLYLPVPLFAFMLICLKIRKTMNALELGSSSS